MNRSSGFFFAITIGIALLVSANELSAQQNIRQPVLDAAQRLEWHRQHLAMRDGSPYENLEWRHIGPMIMSGRVTDIAKPTDKPFTFYVATASGGVWRTRNEGTDWEPIFDDAPSASVGTVAVDPSNADNLWVGLGESNIFRSSMAGVGVYKSTNEGRTWEYSGLGDTQHIARILIHPEDSNTVFVAACGNEYTTNKDRGVYKTTDGGETWTKVLYESDMAGAIDLVMDPSDPDTLYASMWHRIRRPWSDPLPGPGGGIYKSTDGGDSWTRLTNGLPPRNTSGRMGLAIAASNPDVVYVLVDSHEIERKAEEGERDAYGRQRQDVLKGAEVYRSDDGGDSWQKVSEDGRTMKRLFSTYGWVFGQIRVDPNDLNTVYIMGVPLLKSTDGGREFKTLNYRGLHGDHHAMWIDPDNSDYIINGNDGGINLSYDGGETWKNIENLPVVQFYNVCVDDADPFNVYGSIQDNNSWRGPSNQRPGRSNPFNWTMVPGGEASYMQVDPDDQNTFYSESFYGSIMRSDLATGETESIKPQPDDDTPLRGQWLAPFTLSPHNSRVVYHGMQYVFRSMDRGDNWVRISDDLTHNDPEKQGNISFATISTLSESPVKFGLLYAGTDDGRLHVTRDGGIEWNEIVDGLPEYKWVSRVEASAFNEGTVYMTMNGKRDNDFQVYVYRSDNYGETWEDISEGIPGGPVNVIREDPWDGDVLYVGTDMGVYVSTDRGDSWNVLGKGIPITFVHDLAIQRREKVMVAATHGRGMFTISIRGIERNLDRDTDEEDAEPQAEQASRAIEGTFRALTYNVAGLPQGISSSSPATNTHQISPLLNAYDLVLAQEDFSYHPQLSSSADHRYQSEPQTEFTAIMNDGLNRFSRSPFSEIQRHAWQAFNGFFGASNDGLAAKGFSAARHTVADGVQIDVYNLHADAGGSPRDQAARAAQFEQLAGFMSEFSSTNMVIVGGDTNLRARRDGDLTTLNEFKSTTGLTDVGHAMGMPDHIDRFLIRDGAQYALTATQWRVADEFVDEGGNALSDHPAINVDFHWHRK
ncbi:MAG: hypothetical protein AAF456_11595 [Planctomycetota bacterium]